MYLKYVLRDERLNIYMMTYGFGTQNKKFQIFLCKKDRMPDDSPYLLCPKKTPPKYVVSYFGMNVQENTQDDFIPLKFVAYIDTHIKIKVDLDVFKRINPLLFPIWVPDAPLEYFEGHEEGYLEVFRVFEMKQTINKKYLERGSRGRNVYYYLYDLSSSAPIRIPFEIIHPVIEDTPFLELKKQLISLLGSNIIKIIDRSVNIPTIQSGYNSYQSDESDEISEFTAELEDIPQKGMATSFPNSSLYALNRANGFCECCNRPAPFFRENGGPYLEIHHKKPLREGGDDSIENVFALCPNCHRELHYGVNRKELEKRLTFSSQDR